MTFNITFSGHSLLTDKLEDFLKYREKLSIQT